jgi:hypothetical protein
MFNLTLIYNLDAVALINEKSSAMESSASDENDASSRDKKEAGTLTAQQVIPSPFRRHHLKFGVLGKRSDGMIKLKSYSIC